MCTPVVAVFPAPSVIVTDPSRCLWGRVMVVPSAVVPSENVQCAATTLPSTAEGLRGEGDRVAPLRVLSDGRGQRRVDQHRLGPAVGVAEVVGDAGLHLVLARCRGNTWVKRAEMGWVSVVPSPKSQLIAPSPWVVAVDPIDVDACAGRLRLLGGAVEAHRRVGGLDLIRVELDRRL